MYKLVVIDVIAGIGWTVKGKVQWPKGEAGNELVCEGWGFGNKINCFKQLVV